MKTDFALSALKLLMGNSWNRAGTLLIASGIAMASGWVSSAISELLRRAGYEVAIPDGPTWLALTLILLGMSMFVLGRVLPETPAHAAAPSLHDKELLLKFRALVTPTVTAFVREHNFGTSFLRSRLDALGEIADTWTGARFEFQDKEVQAAFAEFLRLNIEFVYLVAVRTYVSNSNMDFSTPLTDIDREEDISPPTRQAIRQMNETATRLASAIDAVERVARRKVPIETSL